MGIILARFFNGRVVPYPNPAQQLEAEQFFDPESGRKILVLVVQRMARKLLALQQRIYAGQNHLAHLSREECNKEVEEPLANISWDIQFFSCARCRLLEFGLFCTSTSQNLRVILDES